MAQEMPDWSELPGDLLVLIARRLNLIEDYLTFGTVCKSWHSSATKQNFNSELPRLPWLMLAEEEFEDDKDSSCRKFFSLYNGMILNKRIPKATGKYCMESLGWLITVGINGEISLLHPFSDVQIELPHLNTMEIYYGHRTRMLFNFLHKAVLSASPCHTSDYVLMVIAADICYLSYWRPGDLRWTRISLEKNSHSPCGDVTYFNGHFYAVDYQGRVLVCNVAGPNPTKSHIVAQVPFCPIDHQGQLYILESLGSLFVVTRNGVQLKDIKDDCHKIPLTLEHEEWDVTYGTTSFRVFHIDLPTGKVSLTMELGDRAFFVGASASRSVQASQFPGIKPNHIYFTDHFFESYLRYEGGGGFDMGVYNLADGSIQPHYKGVSLSRVCPSTWVTPTLLKNKTHSYVLY